MIMLQTTDNPDSLALHEMRLVATKVLWNFDLELCPESRGTWLQQKMYWGLWEKPSLWLKFSPARS